MIVIILVEHITLNKNILNIKQGATTLRGCLHPHTKLQGIEKINANELWSNNKRKNLYLI